MFGKFTKIMFCLSALGCLVCMGLSIYVATVEPVWYVVAALFALAAVWFAASAYRVHKDSKNQQNDQQVDEKRK